MRAIMITSRLKNPIVKEQIFLPSRTATVKTLTTTRKTWSLKVSHLN